LGQNGLNSMLEDDKLDEEATEMALYAADPSAGKGEASPFRLTEGDESGASGSQRAEHCSAGNKSHGQQLAT
jgi:hypothetical protein